MHVTGRSFRFDAARTFEKEGSVNLYLGHAGRLGKKEVIVLVCGSVNAVCISGGTNSGFEIIWIGKGTEGAYIGGYVKYQKRNIKQKLSGIAEKRRL